MPLLTSGSRLIRHKASSNGLLTNLVAYWGLDEAAGANNALDKHTGGLTLTQTGSPGSAAGKVYAGARTFDGSTQLFSRASAAALQMGDLDFAIAAWVYIGTKGSFNHIVSKQTGTGVAEYILRYDGGASDKYAFWVRNGSNTAYASVLAASFGSPPTGQWSLVIAQHDSVNNNISIQVNNGTIDTTSHTGGVYQNTHEFNVGSQLPTPTLAWNGRLGPIQVWKNRTLDASARTALYNAGSGLAYAAFTA